MESNLILSGNSRPLFNGTPLSFTPTEGSNCLKHWPFLGLSEQYYYFYDQIVHQLLICMIIFY